MITVARITPLAAETSTSVSLLLVVCLVATFLVALTPAVLQLNQWADRLARRFRQASRDMDAWIEEDAPRPEGPA